MAVVALVLECDRAAKGRRTIMVSTGLLSGPTLDQQDRTYSVPLSVRKDPIGYGVPTGGPPKG